MEKLPYFNTTIYRCCYTHVSLITTNSKDVYFFPDVARPPYPTVLLFPLFPVGAEGARGVHLFSLTWCGFKAALQFVVVWMKCPALVTRTLKKEKKNTLISRITSAGMSRQAMSTTATVGCLNSCYSFSYHICVSSCVSPWLLCTVAHAVAPARRSCRVFSLHQLRRLFFRANGYIKKKVLVCVVNHSQLPPKQLACLILNTTLFLLLISDWISVVFSCGHLRAQ